MKNIALFASAVAATVPGVLSSRQLRHRSSICGAQGYDDGTNAYNKSRQASYAACSTWCQTDPTCESFAYGSGKCYVYDVPVAGNFQADSDSPYMFYDLSCISSTSTSTAFTSTASTTTAKASSTFFRSALGTSKITASTSKPAASSSTTIDCGDAVTTTTTAKASTSPSTLATKRTTLSSTTSKLTTKSTAPATTGRFRRG